MQARGSRKRRRKITRRGHNAARRDSTGQQGARAQVEECAGAAHGTHGRSGKARVAAPEKRSRAATVGRVGARERQGAGRRGS